MSDPEVKQTVQFAGEPAGQPANVSQAATPGEPVQEKQSGALTEDQIRKIVQSEKDKLATQLRETLAAELRQPVTPPKVEPPAAPVAPVNEGKVSTPPPATASGAGADPQRDLVNQLQADLVAEYGIAIDTTDPEAQSIVRTSGVEYIRTYKAALKAKAQRLQQSQTQTISTPPQARIPMAGGGGSSVSLIHNITDPTTLLRMGLGGK